MMSNSIDENGNPFSISVSTDVELFTFNKSWRHLKHYQGVFNSQFDVLGKHKMLGTRWAMVADWRKWLVQVPEAERLCIRSIGNFTKQGLTYFAPVCDKHPIAKWQAQKVIENNQSLHCEIYYDCNSALEWLKGEGFDTQVKPEPFVDSWMKPSVEFDQILKDLEVTPTRFVTTY